MSNLQRFISYHRQRSEVYADIINLAKLTDWLKLMTTARVSLSFSVSLHHKRCFMTCLTITDCNGPQKQFKKKKKGTGLCFPLTVRVMSRPRWASLWTNLLGSILSLLSLIAQERPLCWSYFVFHWVNPDMIVSTGLKIHLLFEVWVVICLSKGKG